jgi:hypothetical protein
MHDPIRMVAHADRTMTGYVFIRILPGPVKTAKAACTVAIQFCKSRIRLLYKLN